MVFLIKFNRRESRIVVLQEFLDNDRSLAEDKRLQMELELGKSDSEHELVLLEAENEEALHQTHGRYFDSMRDIVEAATSTNV